MSKRDIDNKKDEIDYYINKHPVWKDYSNLFEKLLDKKLSKAAAEFVKEFNRINDEVHAQIDYGLPKLEDIIKVEETYYPRYSAQIIIPSKETFQKIKLDAMKNFCNNVFRREKYRRALYNRIKEKYEKLVN